jgi:AmmeMemoRadiSam system protein A
MSTTFGVIAPHPPIMLAAVGGTRSSATEASAEAMRIIRDALVDFAPQTVVLVSPHAPAYLDEFAVDDSVLHEGDLAAFGDSLRRVWRGDSELAAEIIRLAHGAAVPCEPRGAHPSASPGVLDHATMVPLAFLDPDSTFSLVVVSLCALGYQAHRDLGSVVHAAAEGLGRRVAFVASGDLSHRLSHEAPSGYSPHGRVLDEAIVRIVRSGRLTDLASIDPMVVEDGGECGLRSFVMLGGYCGEDSDSRVLSYESPWGVGYLTAVVGARAVGSVRDVSVHPPDSGRKGGTAGNPESEIVALAREALERKVRGGAESISPELHDSLYPSRAGVFVTLHRGGKLRGCIGTVIPAKSTLAEEVVANAVEAAIHDPRFPAITAEELEDLEVGVDVLHEPESCTFDELDPAVFGVIVSSRWRRGLLLPDLEGVHDAAQQVEIAMRKAHINRGEPRSLERFGVDRYT